MPRSSRPGAVERDSILLAPYAMHSTRSRGRLHAETSHPYRSPFQRDRDRIVHSAAFRRLSHKTQVFTGDQGDYHRTRLTHTLEVASIARTMARALRLNEDLVESLALMHDLGHPPFGHAGEDALAECGRKCGGFNHNAQALRIVEKLEVRYATFAGLNLSWEILDSQRFRTVKHDGPDVRPTPLLEAQVVDAADSIAYDSHDADDALELRLLDLDDLLDIPLWAEAAEAIRATYPDLNEHLLRQAIVRELIDRLVGDAVAEADRRIREAGIESVEDVRDHEVVITASPAMATPKRELETFLFRRVYRHPAVLAQRELAQEALKQMFEEIVAGRTSLPADLERVADEEGLQRAAIDYLAGMTDRGAWRHYRERSRLHREG